MLFQSINCQSDHKNNIHSKQPERNEGLKNNALIDGLL